MCTCAPSVRTRSSSDTHLLPKSTLSLVFTAGNADTFSRVLLTLKILRNHYNTSLPAEIFSFPGEMPPPELLDEFVKYNATLRVVSSNI